MKCVYNNVVRLEETLWTVPMSVSSFWYCPRIMKEIPFGRSRLSVLRTPRTFFCTFLWIWNCFKIKDFWSLYYFKFRRSLLLLELTFQHTDQDAAPMVPGLPELPVPADLSHTPGQVMSLLWSSIPHLQKEDWMTVQSSCSSRDAGPHMD